MGSMVLLRDMGKFLREVLKVVIIPAVLAPPVWLLDFFGARSNVTDPVVSLVIYSIGVGLAIGLVLVIYFRLPAVAPTGSKVATARTTREGEVEVDVYDSQHVQKVIQELRRPGGSGPRQSELRFARSEAERGRGG